VKKDFSPHAFVLPALLIFLIFFIFPNAYVFYLSMYELSPEAQPNENMSVTICPRYQDENNTYAASFMWSRTVFPALVEEGKMILSRFAGGTGEWLGEDNFPTLTSGKWYRLRVDVSRDENLDIIKFSIYGLDNVENGYKSLEVTSQPLFSDGMAFSAYFNRDFAVSLDSLKIRKHAVVEPEIILGGESPSTMENWTTRREYVIENTGILLENYQVMFTVEYSENMRADFGDLRFTYGDESTLLDYWVESITTEGPNPQSATVWVKVPLIPENDSATIYMHYGNPEAESMSDIHTTFIFGDDFENSAWTDEHLTSSGGIFMGAENGIYFIEGQAGEPANLEIGGDQASLPENYTVELKVRIEKRGSWKYGLTFVGGQNFVNLLGDGKFLASLAVVGGISIQSIVVQVPAGLALALILRKVRGSRTFLTIFFLPMTISLVTLTLMWRYMVFSPEGILHAVFGWTLDPTKDPLTLFIAVNIIADWIYIRLYALIFSSALKSIPSSVFDAAKVDGLSGFQTLRKVVIPALKNIILVSIIMCISGTFKTFDTWWVLGGGPSAPLHLPSTYLVTTLGSGLVGYASAIAVVCFFICLGIVVLQLRAMKVRV